jgi:hypothetical protein
METPYRIYGGLQDNGSWAGPAYAWYGGGIINEFWDFLIGGDGFDAIPVKGDPRYCYAQSQGGALRRVDLLTGSTKSIRPAADRNERLRFNWNAAIAQDPFDDNTIYFGSQFLHKSTNKGDSWEKISPDLTTNDSEKMNQLKSGGITVDATGAEVHCTILTIAPSPVQKGLLWAGTDDGNVQYTSDGGKNWTNVSSLMKGAPVKAWIPQITASAYNPAEAWVVLNNYRTGDYAAYLYYTNNYGKTWQRIIDDSDVWGYVICFVQDPIEPKLMFAGTEYALYVSFDKGENWNKWTEGYPTVSTYDLAIHPRESDLIIGTFGRSVWIIDNIAPLRALAKSSGNLLNEKIALFIADEGIMASTKNLPGYYYRGDAVYEGENRPLAASIICYANETKPEKALFEVLSEDGMVVKNFDAELKRGFNKILWRFDRNVPLMPGQIKRNTQQTENQEDRTRFLRQGSNVIPGEYMIKATFNSSVTQVKMSVKGDPRITDINVDVMKENYKEADVIISRIKEMNGLYQQFYDFSILISKTDELIKKNQGLSEALKDFHPRLSQKYNDTEKKLSSRPDGLFARINAYRVLTSATGRLNDTERKGVDDAATALDEAVRILNDFINTDWPAYQKNIAGRTVPLEAVLKQ